MRYIRQKCNSYKYWIGRIETLVILFMLSILLSALKFLKIFINFCKLYIYLYIFYKFLQITHI